MLPNVQLPVNMVQKNISTQRNKFKTASKKPHVLKNYTRWSKKHNRLNVGRIALERLLGALINCTLLPSGEGGGA